MHVVAGDAGTAAGNPHIPIFVENNSVQAYIQIICWPSSYIRDRLPTHGDCVASGRPIFAELSKLFHMKAEGSCCAVLHLRYQQADYLSGKPGNVSDFDSRQGMSGILLKVREVSGNNLVRVKWPKTLLLLTYLRLYRYLVASS